MSEQLEHARQREVAYVLAARKLSAEYDVARAIYWRGERRRSLHERRARLVIDAYRLTAYGLR